MKENEARLQATPEYITMSGDNTEILSLFASVAPILKYERKISDETILSAVKFALSLVEEDKNDVD